MNIKTTGINAVLVTAIGLMAVAGCGYWNARDAAVKGEAPAHAVDVSALKAAALSSWATNRHVVGASNGYVTELTIEPTLQRIVSETLVRHADTNDTGIGWAVLMSVKDGAVLALADCGGDADAPRPFAITRMFMPGHLISPLTVAAAIDAGIATPDSELFTDASEAFYHQYRFPRDVGQIWESRLSVSNAIVYSSNVVLSKLGILVGRDKEYDVLTRFGIGMRSGMGFSGELVGRLLPPDRWCSLHRTRIPIGQGVEITSIQIARAYATLANHGLRVDPYVVKRITDASGATLYAHAASANTVQAVSRKAADSTCAILEGAVKADDLKGFDGLKDEEPPDIAKSLVPRRATGCRAAVKGVRVAGKTATPHRMKTDGHEFEADKFVASFAGFFPVESPKYVLVVCFETKRIEDIPYIHQGGGRPAMAFAEIVGKLVYGHNRTGTKTGGVQW